MPAVAFRDYPRRTAHGDARPCARRRGELARRFLSERGLLADAAALALALEAAWSVAGTERVRVFGSTALRVGRQRSR